MERVVAGLGGHQIASGSNNPSTLPLLSANESRWTPKLHNPGTVDCVSCHVAQPAKIWAMRQYPWLQLDNVSRDIIYNSKLNIRNMSPMQMHTNIVRAFGYFMNQPFVAQRTINESAEVVNYLNGLSDAQ